MVFVELAPELVHQIYNTLYSINDVINLSLTCRRFNVLLKHSQKLPTLFAAAEREFGPLEDVAQLVTFNASQPAHLKRHPQQNYALLRQMIKIGGVAQKCADIFPERRWQDNYLERRTLSNDEVWRLRRAVYRYWLYCEAFQGRGNSRSMRMLPYMVEERAQLLRTWTTEELSEIEDVRLVLEDLVSLELCPTHGAAQREFNQHCDFAEVRQTHQNVYTHRSWNSWPPDSFTSQLLSTNIFHNYRDEQILSRHLDLPVPQRRKLEMMGWGDEISQYYVVQSMMKLNPAQIMYLYEHTTRKQDIERWLAEHIGEEWFWDNGQTWLDTWNLVLYKRGLDPEWLQLEIQEGRAGVTNKAGSSDQHIEQNHQCLY
ncbi:hypothetical protein LTS08_008209 [Lithohypha guttulata]|nr:hypothetical protein LTS08_008209 [Lithohypha guttulata]